MINADKIRLSAFLVICGFIPMHLSVFGQAFTEVSDSAGIHHVAFSPALIGGGVIFFDYNNDGWLDIYMTGGTRQDVLYRNNGDGTFTDRTVAAGLAFTRNVFTTGAVSGDIDNDGDRDLFITTWMNEPNYLLRNNGNGTFTNISAQAGVNDIALSVPASFGDFNLDGYLDLYVGNYVQRGRAIYDTATGQVYGFRHTCYANFFYINNGNRTFTRVADSYGVADTGCTLATAFTDYDMDDDLDLYVANDFGEWTTPNKLYENQYPSDLPADVSISRGLDIAFYAMGVAVGDYDEDGDFDYYITNLGRNALLQNQGNNTFVDVTDYAGVTNTYYGNLFTTSWGTAFIDYDNNTLYDLFVSNGQIPAAQFIATSPVDPNKLFRNNGDGTFTDISDQENMNHPGLCRGLAAGDYDNDGDVDLLFGVVDLDTGVNLVNHSLLYRNNSSANGNHYLQVELEGVKANRDGFGAKVRAVAGGRSFIQEVDGGGASHASQHMSILHFGLGNYTMADTVEVIWPGGNRQYLTNVPADQRISIVEDVTGLCGRKVKNPHAVMVTAHSARLAWEPEHYAIAYRIRGRKVGATSWKYFTLHGGNKHYFDISNLQEGTAYEWQVRAFCDTSGTNHTGWSVKDTFVTGCNYPAMLFTSNITHQSAVLNWSPVYGNKGYIVKGREAGSQQWQRYWVEPNRNFLRIDGLQPGKSYEWAVKTRCDMDGAFSSPYSPVAIFTTPANTNKLAANPPKTGNSRVPLVFPNPASNDLFISLPQGIDDGRVSIFNSSGSLIYQKILPPSEGGLWLDVSNWHEGMYILRFTHGKQTGYNKFIIAR